MNTLKRIMISIALVGLPLSALAGNDGRGHGHGHRHHHKHYDKHHHGHHGHHYRHHDRHDRHVHHHHYYRHHDHHARHHYYGPHVRPARVYVPAPPPVVYYPQGVSVHGNVHIPF